VFEVKPPLVVGSFINYIQTSTVTLEMEDETIVSAAVTEQHAKHFTNCPRWALNL
jgi:hypothetical protein